MLALGAIYHRVIAFTVSLAFETIKTAVLKLILQQENIEVTTSCVVLNSMTITRKL